jgi:hypothetical protein
MKGDEDLLDSALSALRQEANSPWEPQRSTRTRIALSMKARNKSRGRPLVFAFAAAACLVASSAWASPAIRRATHDWIASTWKALAPTRSLPHRPRISSADLHVPASSQTAAPIIAPIDPTPSPSTTSLSSSAGAIAQNLAPPSHAIHTTSPTAPPFVRAVTPQDDTDAEYVLAHRAHFFDRDPSRALPLWEAYLRDAPAGRFAPEAKYNAALCMVRLGRVDDARIALQPFANGAFDGYRQSEASDLLQAIARRQATGPLE